MYSTVLIDRQNKSLAVLYSFFNRNKKIKITGTFKEFSNAMAFINNQPPAIIIVDMATMENNGAIYWLQIKSLQDQSCVFITSYHLDDTVKMAASEVSGYLLKPVGHEDVDNVVQNAKIARNTRPAYDKV